MALKAASSNLNANTIQISSQNISQDSTLEDVYICYQLIINILHIGFSLYAKLKGQMHFHFMLDFVVYVDSCLA